MPMATPVPPNNQPTVCSPYESGKNLIRVTPVAVNISAVRPYASKVLSLARSVRIMAKTCCAFVMLLLIPKV